jgi:hypothetical protein
MVFRPGGERVHHLPLIHILNVGSGSTPRLDRGPANGRNRRDPVKPDRSFKRLKSAHLSPTRRDKDQGGWLRQPRRIMP